MKPTPVYLWLGLLLHWLGAASQPLGAQQSTPSAAATSQTELEVQLQKSLTQVVLEGRWSLVGPDGLGTARSEKYTIQGISKVGGNLWLVQARIQYGDKDATVPVPVKVSWVEGTPILHITDLAIPGVGTYTARVVIQGNMYAGTWSGGNHGGIMNGLIRPAPKP